MRILYMSYDGMTDPLGQSQVIPYLIGLKGKGYNITLLSCEKKDNFYSIHQSSEISNELLTENCKLTNGNYIHNLLESKGIRWEHIISQQSTVNSHQSSVFYSLFTIHYSLFTKIWDIYKLRRKAKRIINSEKRRAKSEEGKMNSSSLITHHSSLQSFDVVHCRSYIPALVGLYLKKKYGLKFVFDMRGFYADERVDGGLWNLNNPVFRTIYKYFKYKERQFLSEANYVVSLTEKGKQIIENGELRMENLKPKFKNCPPISQIYTKNLKPETLNWKLKVIPCCVDLRLFSDNYIKQWRMENGELRIENYELDKNFATDSQIKNLKSKIVNRKSDLVISYLGSIGTWYMLDEMLQFFKRIILQYQNAKFLFITPDNKDIILNQAAKLGIDESYIRIIKAAREEVPVYLALSNVSIFFVKPVFSKKASSPTKQGEIMSLGIPIICNANIGDTDLIINETQTGHIVKEFTIEEYDKAADSIKELIQIPKERIKRTAEKYYSLEMGIERYNEIYRELGIGD